ncbi:ferrous iron transport protein A [Microbacterium protaetiae]|uniref:Ferrous iron transport protein A n=1 Tax=Microbacterium protaetiae TaxID=2509458 RepID=A0A4P6ECB8_9MICO|nr:ferrous iron transport protein A [Microbacterium protaetiae]QAY59870.1 ferrous iron transport protein A [Microbacterium protaetiae]
MPDPVAFLRSCALGTRVTVRRRVDDGWTDALGYLRELTPEACVVETRRGMVTVPLEAVTHAIRVPEPPPRRAR